MLMLGGLTVRHSGRYSPGNRQPPERTAAPHPLHAPPRQVEDILKKQQEKEKKMWSKAFS